MRQSEKTFRIYCGGNGIWTARLSKLTKGIQYYSLVTLILWVVREQSDIVDKSNLLGRGRFVVLICLWGPQRSVYVWHTAHTHAYIRLSLLNKWYTLLLLPWQWYIMTVVVEWISDGRWRLRCGRDFFFKWAWPYSYYCILDDSFIFHSPSSMFNWTNAGMFIPVSFCLLSYPLKDIPTFNCL